MAIETEFVLKLTGTAMARLCKLSVFLDLPPEAVLEDLLKDSLDKLTTERTRVRRGRRNRGPGYDCQDDDGVGAEDDIQF